MTSEIHNEPYIEGLDTLDEAEEDQPVPEGVQLIHDLLFNSDIHESPIDIHVAATQPLEVPELIWHHLELPPKKVKFTNTGHTVILSAKWMQERPYISGGPLIGNYVFSQLHFHWGASNMEGSEHTVSGARHVLEMHVVFFRSCYLTQESALKKKDGMVVAVYMFKLQDEPNPSISILTDAIYQIRDPHTSIRLKSYSLETFVKPFNNDYFLYAGSVNTSTCVHCILWMISREPVGISIRQVDIFRSLLDINSEPLLKNYREIQPLNNRPVYHANPSGYLHQTLLAIQRDFDVKMSKKPQQVNKYPRSSKEYQAATGTTIYRSEIVTGSPFIGDFYQRGGERSGGQQYHRVMMSRKVRATGDEQDENKN